MKKGQLKLEKQEAPTKKRVNFLCMQYEQPNKKYDLSVSPPHQRNKMKNGKSIKDI